MSDIYLRNEANPNPPKLSEFFNFTQKDWNTEDIDSNSYIYLRRNDNAAIWAPIIKRDNISLYILGRVTFNEQTWKAAQSLSENSGGLACNYLYHLYIKKGLGGVIENLNGACCIVIKDKNDDIYVITDKMGFFPIYYANTPTKTILSSHPDAIAKDTEFSELDMASLGEYLSYGKVEHPNTYYLSVKQLNPASIYKFSINQQPRLIQKYFYPEFKWQKESPKELTNQLKNALYTSVQDRSHPILGKSGIFLSGGMDSRGILASMQDTKNVISATFYDEENEELATAKAIAKSYGSTHLALKRTQEFYIENAQRAATLMAGQWNVTDAHYTGFINELLNSGIQNWLSGCFADWMFKGLASNTKYLKILGKVIPIIKRLDAFNEVYFQPKFNIANHNLTSEIEYRRKSIYQGIENLQGEVLNWNIEKARLFPINRESTMGTRHILSRTLRWDPVLADNSLLEVFQKIPVSYKLKHNIWGNAVGAICKGHNNIKDNNWGARVNAGEIEKITSFIFENIKRKIRKSTKPASGIVTTGSWPNFSYVASKSKQLPNIWQNINTESYHIIREITGVDYSKEGHTNLIKNDLEYFFRLLTILLWLENRNN